MADLTLEWRGTVYELELDYWGLPFRCSTCNKVGHLKAQCSGRPIKQLECPGLLTNPSSIKEAPGMNEPHVESLALDMTTLSIPDISLIGKLQLYSPSLIASLSLEEFLKLKVSLLNDSFILKSGINKEGLASLKESSMAAEGGNNLDTNPLSSLNHQTVPGLSVDTIPKPSSGDSSTPVGSVEIFEDIYSFPQIALEYFSQPVESESITDVIPSYRDLLQKTILPVYSGGRIIVGKTSSEVLTSPGTKGKQSSDPKGSIQGGLDLEFSPLKTRNARKLKGLVSDSPQLTSPPSHVPRALRAQKALARGLT